MNITESQRKQARELAAKHGYKELYLNDKGELFTSQNHASMSVNNDKEKYQKLSIGIEVNTEKATNDLGKAADVITEIEAATDVDAIEAILIAETEGKNRKSVIDAGAKKIESLSKNAQ
jgi:hypothetical protein